MDASDHDALVAEQRLQAIAGHAVGVEDERRRSFLAAAAAAGHHHVLDIGQFGQPVGAPEMGERGAAADHFHQPRHFTIDVRRRYETVADGCRQRFDGDPESLRPRCRRSPPARRASRPRGRSAPARAAPGAMSGRSRAR